jgi:hypothetical protein
MHHDEFSRNYILAKANLEKCIAAPDSSETELRIAAQQANEAWLKLKNTIPQPNKENENGYQETCR